MKKIIALVLVMLMCLSFAACGGESLSKEESPKLTAESEIIGKWQYYTGFTTWNFIFNEDMTCSYWSGVNEPDYSTYKMDNGELFIEGLDWQLYYELSDGVMRFWQDSLHSDGSRSTWEFSKDTTYDPSDVTGIILTEQMIDEIEQEYTSSTFPDVLLAIMTLRYENLEFTDWEMTNAKKIDQYTFVLYGVLYAKDNYGQYYKQNSNVIFTAVEDAEKESGYSIDWDVEFVD